MIEAQRTGIQMARESFFGRLLSFLSSQRIKPMQMKAAMDTTSILFDQLALDEFHRQQLVQFQSIVAISRRVAHD